MIELVSEEQCITCGLCVKVCPTFVFNTHESGIPVIARQEDCQTCFVCEAHCPADALYVAPYADTAISVNEEDLVASGVLGSWRATVGWGPGRTRLAAIDSTEFINRILPPRPQQRSY